MTGIEIIILMWLSALTVLVLINQRRLFALDSEFFALDRRLEKEVFEKGSNFERKE